MFRRNSILVQLEQLFSLLEDRNIFTLLTDKYWMQLGITALCYLYPKIVHITYIKSIHNILTIVIRSNMLIALDNFNN